MQKLKVGRDAGQDGSKHPIKSSDSERAAFETLKKTHMEGLELQTVDPDRPFILRVDASGRAIGAALEQSVDSRERPTLEDATKQRTAPVAFLAYREPSTWLERTRE